MTKLMPSRRAAASLVAGALALFALPSGAAAVDVTGAGASLPAPLYQRWGATWSGQSGNRLNYQSIGSGAGRTQIQNRTVDFGASDSPMKPEELDSKKLFQFPAVMAGIVIGVNVPGLSSIKLTPEVVASIYRGQVKTWNDPAIAGLNAGANLPATAITPIYRSDSSGTTDVFTKYLERAAGSQWSSVGSGSTVNWPTGTGAKGNEGVSAAVKSRQGAIGYMEYSFATQNRITMAQLRNKGGNFVAASPSSIQAAAGQADWANAKRFTVDLINLGGAGTYPIVTPTYVIMPKDPKDPARAKAAIQFFDWAFRSGDGAASSLGYVPVPEIVANRARAQWKEFVRSADGQAIY